MRSPQQQRLYRIVWWGVLGESMSKLARDLLLLMAAVYGFRIWKHEPVVFGLYAAAFTGGLVALILLGVHLQKQSRIRRAQWDAEAEARRQAEG